MPEEKNTLVGVSVKFPTAKKEGLVSIEEFNTLFELSGDKNKSRFIHKAILHYADVIRQHLEDERTTLDQRSKRFNELFPPKP